MSLYRSNKPKFLDQLVKNNKLTADGRDWLTLALDPFHDYEHPAAGFPDADGSQTLVSCYTYQYDLSKPAGLVGNWDAHVYNTPLCSFSNKTMTSVNAQWTSLIHTADSKILAPLVIESGPSGSDLSNPAGANVNCAGLPALGVEDLVAGITRVIGMGFEITNTTSSLNKQGAVTTYRMPQYVDSISQVGLCNLAATVKGSVNVRRFRKPPQAPSVLNIMKGSRTWEAAEGVYATCVMNSEINPMMMADNVVCIESTNAHLGNVSVDATTGYTNVWPNVGPALTAFAGDLQQITPFDTTGAYFTGLSEETTLTIKLRVYVEKAPGWTEPALAVLCTPSAGRDDLAMTLYSHAISQLPVAVTVKENGIGDWFKGVVNVLRDVSSTAGVFMNPIMPGSAQLGRAVSTVLDTVSRAIPSKKPQAPRIMNAVSNAVKKVANDKDAKKIAAAAGRIRYRKAMLKQ